ncbi:MAG: hypothetical protein ACKUBY_01165 [Candidatus Moraniibacteriota bacterium]|jgi:beta-1,2-mannobiose phosphorylase / 1,2-beta-oligomannan phosphorylase
MKNKNTIRGLGSSLIEGKSYIFVSNPKDAEKGSFTVRESDDGITFETLTTNAKVVNINGPSDDFSKCNFFHISKDGKDYYLTYRLCDEEKLCFAKSKNLIDWEKKESLDCGGGNAKIVTEYLYAGRNVMYVGGGSITLCVSEDFEKWSRVKKELISAEKQKLDVEFFITDVQVVDDGVFVMYAKSQKDENGIVQYDLHGALFDYGDPTKLLWQSCGAIYTTENTTVSAASIFGTVLFDDYFVSYWIDENDNMFLVRHFYNLENEAKEGVCEIEEQVSEGHEHDVNTEITELKRVVQNPIMSPREHRNWEAIAAYNPTAIEDDGTIHIIYRADGHDLKSVWGYASTDDGVTIENRSKQSIYQRLTTGKRTNVSPQTMYTSGNNGGGGCEDPRAVLINGIVYVTFTAFDGWGSVRVGLTSIDLEDFKNNNWNWNDTTLISPPGEMNKNWVIFPEKINGKFAILHSFSPEILIDYFDSLEELDGDTFITSNNTRPIDTSRGWDSWFRGVGPAPLKTDVGWLVFYHAMDHTNPDRYRLGALLLDLNDPTKEICRSQGPVLEPEADYENDGHKWGVIYSCGAVIKDDTIFVYYGGADKFTCVAKASKDEFLDKLTKNQEIKMVIG